MTCQASRTARLPRWLGGALLVALSFGSGRLAANATWPQPDDVFAAVNGRPISYQNFFSRLEDIGGLETASRVIMEELLEQACAQAGLTPTAEEVDNRLRAILAADFGGNAQLFATWMAENGMTDEALRRRVRFEMMDLRLRTKDVPVTDEALRAFHQEHRALRYDRPEGIRYRQIVLSEKPRAEELLAQLQTYQLSFFQAASRYSVAPDAEETGGLVGPRPLPLLEQAAKPIHDALTRLEPNKIAEQPVYFAGHWYLLLLVERIPGREVPFEQIAEQVRRDYLLTHAPSEDAFYSTLRQTAVVAGVPARYRVVEQGFGPDLSRRAPAAETGPAPAQPAPRAPAGPPVPTTPQPGTLE